MRTFYIKGTTPKWKLLTGEGHPFPIIAWLIRLLTWFDISHVLYDLKDEDEVFHVYLTERRSEPRLPYFNSGLYIKHIFEIQVPEDKYLKMLELMKNDQVPQKGYYIQLIGIALATPFRLLGLKIENPLRFIYGNSQTCSEHIARTFGEVFGIDWFKEIPYSIQTERDTIEILEKRQVNLKGATNIKVRRIR